MRREITIVLIDNGTQTVNIQILLDAIEKCVYDQLPRFQGEILISTRQVKQ